MDAYVCKHRQFLNLLHVCHTEKLKLKIDKPTEKTEAVLELEEETVSVVEEEQQEMIAPEFLEVYDELVGIISGFYLQMNEE